MPMNDHVSFAIYKIGWRISHFVDALEKGRKLSQE
jgi:hypothetical protein